MPNIPQIFRDHIEAIVQLTDEEFDYIYSLLVIKEYKKNQLIIREGETVNYNYFILEGLVKLTFTDFSGKQHIVSFAMEDWWETDFPAYLNQTKASMDLHCLEATTVLCLSFENFNQLCARINKMESFFLRKASLGFIAAQKRILSLLTANAKERYERLIKLQPKLLQRVSKSQLAAYLGVSRETLSRIYH